MCFQVLAIVASVVGSLAQAAVSSSMAKQQAEIQKQQLRADIENERIRSTASTADRMGELVRAESSNRAALSAVGVNQNFSYEQGILPYNQSVAAKDVGRDQFNSTQQIYRKRYDISVADWKAKATSRSAWAEAGVGIMSDVVRIKV